MTTDARTTSLGEAFADALSRKDFDEVTALLHPEVDFRGLTPGRMWEASDARTVVEDVLKSWFDPSDAVERLVSTETDAYSPVTGRSYSDSCSYNGYSKVVSCSHGSDLIEFAYASH